jgi:SAM-dependent methyltransferase
MSTPGSFPWPPLKKGGPAPVWSGQGFAVGDEEHPFLQYQDDEHAWEDSLLQMHEKEAGADHFIDIASREQAVEGLRFAGRADGVVLEVGISSGYLLPMLRQAYPDGLVIGADLQRDVSASFHRRDPSFPLMQFDLTACPLPDASVDVFVALNVLEHIQDDAQAMREIYRILKPGGIAILEVPAGAWLFDIYDSMLNHYRRYSMSGLLRLVRQAGLQPLWRSHLGFFLFPGFAAVKLLNRLQYREDPAGARAKVAKQIGGSRRQPFFSFLMRLERRIGRHLYLPFGIRCLMVARKPGPWQGGGKA